MLPVVRALALAMLALGVVAGCEGLDGPDGGPNAPCTRSSHCAGGLVCLEGVCGEHDAGADASVGDAAAGPEPEPDAAAD